MVVFHLPPVRTSISHSDVDMPSGPHHCTSISGFVQASKTFSGVALKSRVMRSVVSSCVMLSATVIIFPLLIVE